jgi:O-antigen/teichoic acid export membrane protein
MANRFDISPARGGDSLLLVLSPAHRRERTAIRSVGLLLLLRGLVVAGGVAAAALVPRTMGPSTYGRYDLITMLTFWFTMLGGLGIGQVVSRQVPQLEHEGAKDKLLALLGNLLVLRVLSSAAVAILYFLTTRLWLRDLDWTVLLALSVAVLLRGPGTLCYSLFLGQGRIGRWAVPEVVRQWGSVAFALPCFLLGGLRGAVGGFLVSETVILVVGLAGARRSIARQALRLDLGAISPLLRVGLAFYASEIVLSALDRSGAVLVRAVTNDYAQVGLYGVSYQIFMAAVLSTNQIANSFVPLITVLRAKHEEAELRLWIERLVKWLSLVATLGFLGSLILGKDIVPLVLGRAYAPVYPNLVAMAAALIFLPLIHACSLLALTHDRPSVLFKAAVVRLLFFWGLGVPLIVRWGSLGACIAVGLATAMQSAYLVGQHTALVGPALRRFAVVVGVGLVFAPVAFLRDSVPVNVALYLAVVGGYLFVLRAMGAISAGELRALVRALGLTRTARDTTEEAGA